MKVESFYDVFCDVCGRSMSRDYACGLCDNAETAVKEARRIGFHMIGGKRVCPVCIKRVSVHCGVSDQNHPLPPFVCDE